MAESPGQAQAKDAERAVIGQMMTKGSRVAGEVIGTQLSPADFHTAVSRTLFETLHAAYFRDDPMDPITVATVTIDRLRSLLGTDDGEEIVNRVRSYTERIPPGRVIDHAKIVKRASDYRKLAQLGADAIKATQEQTKTPQEIGADISHQSMMVATSTLLTTDILSFGDLGRRYVENAEAERAARAAGKELGAHFGLKFIDQWTRGVRPTEFWIIGGEPGAGKSAVSWAAATKFAERQAQHNPPHEQVGTLVLSLEMGEGDSETRIAQSISKVDGAKLREARQTDDDMRKIVAEWGRRKDLPLYFNFSSTIRASQLRAIVVEAIRRHNCGLIVIDHFRYFDMDHRIRDNPTVEDEEKARFLKEDIAKDLNVAVICLAHTTKSVENQADRRPTLSNLRGSGQVAAHADFVSFVYRPYMYASENAKDMGEVFDTDAEMIFRKNRHGIDGISRFTFEPHTMTVKDPDVAPTLSPSW
jgi:replicative DNA helicase